MLIIARFALFQKDFVDFFKTHAQLRYHHPKHTYAVDGVHQGHKNGRKRHVLSNTELTRKHLIRAYPKHRYLTENEYQTLQRINKNLLLFVLHHGVDGLAVQVFPFHQFVFLQRKQFHRSDSQQRIQKPAQRRLIFVIDLGAEIFDDGNKKDGSNAVSHETSQRNKPQRPAEGKQHRKVNQHEKNVQKVLNDNRVGQLPNPDSLLKPRHKLLALAVVVVFLFERNQSVKKLRHELYLKPKPIMHHEHTSGISQHYLHHKHQPQPYQQPQHELFILVDEHIVQHGLGKQRQHQSHQFQQKRKQQDFGQNALIFFDNGQIHLPKNRYFFFFVLFARFDQFGVFIKCLGRFELQHDAAPFVGKLLFGIFCFAKSGVRNAYVGVGGFVNHHKMLPFVVGNAGQLNLLEVFVVQLITFGFEPVAFGDFEQRVQARAFLRDFGKLSQ